MSLQVYKYYKKIRTTTGMRKIVYGIRMVSLVVLLFVLWGLEKTF